jgi:hypothetical protein
MMVAVLSFLVGGAIGLFWAAAGIASIEAREKELGRELTFGEFMAQGFAGPFRLQ